MNKELSNYLDIVRVVASFAVFFQHLSTYNNDVFPWFLNYGHIAVMAFFILSGYVIAYVADKKEKTLEVYLKHRFARIYSVMIVAWLLTIFLDSFGSLINSNVYEGMVANDYAPIRIFSHLLFLHQSWFIKIQFFSNVPLWSLAYEFWYYILFGIVILYKGKFKLAITITVMLIMGPVTLIYGLIWATGTILFRLHQSNNQHNQALSSILFILSIPVLFSFPYWQHFVQYDLFSYDKLNLGSIIKDFVFAIFMTINIYLFKYSAFSFTYLKSVIRFFSGISFSLYVFHFPLILFYKAILNRYTSLPDHIMFIIMVVLVLISVYLLSFISEKQKNLYFDLFSKLFNGLKPFISKIRFT